MGRPKSNPNDLSENIKYQIRRETFSLSRFLQYHHNRLNFIRLRTRIYSAHIRNNLEEREKEH